MTKSMKNEDIKREVRRSYAEVATNSGSCCGSSAGTERRNDLGGGIGYSEEELETAPIGSNMGLGCGNPTAIASLKKGETVLDLGSGGGFDCFLAANKVGKTGKVIGVDMTPEMIDKARRNTAKGGYKNVEFRLGEIESLPVADSSVDVIISNCVINLAPDKKRVFEEAFRVLKPGGRAIISDVVLLKRLPAKVSESIPAYVGCVAGASMKEDYLRMIENAGFTDVRVLEESRISVQVVEDEKDSRKSIKPVKLDAKDAKRIIDSIASINVYATKPLTK